MFAHVNLSQGYKIITKDLEFVGEIVAEILFLLLNMLIEAVQSLRQRRGDK